MYSGTVGRSGGGDPVLIHLFAV